MTEETQHKVKEIKQSLRQLMNGVTAKSMREKGMTESQTTDEWGNG